MILYEDEAIERKFKELDDQIREVHDRIDRTLELIAKLNRHNEENKKNLLKIVEK